MNLKGTRDQFLECMQKVSPAAQSGSITPILSNVLLRAEVASVDIIATDQETQMKAPCQVKANKKFNATVSAKKFQDILRRLDSDGEVSFDYQEGKGKDSRASINISCGKARYKLNTIDASEFPRLGEKAGLKPFMKIPAAVLLDALKRVAYSSAINSHRMNLNGVLLESSVKGLRVVATDGHRMAVQDLPADNTPGELQLILPRKSVNELIRNLPGEGDSEIEIKASDRVARFTAASFELTSTLITENFPDYKSVIPQNNDKTITVARAELLAGLHRVSAVASGDRGITVIINFDKGAADLECVNRDNETATDKVSAKYDGEKIEIGFNTEFLTDMLSVVEEDGFQIKVLDPSSSVLFEPGGKKKPAFMYVVMPVRL